MDPFTAAEAVAILELLEASLEREGQIVTATIVVSDPECIYAHVRLDSPMPTQEVSLFRNSLCLSYDEFRRLRAGEMTADEFRAIAASKLMRDF